MSFLPPPPEHHDGGEGGSWRRRDRGRRGRELQHDKNWRDIRALGASAEQEEKVKSLMIQGYAADLVADDETALALHQENHMIRWRGQEDDPIVIDRFDGRALLDDRSKFAKMKGRRRVDDYDDQEQAAEEAKLDKERYSDLVDEQGSEDEGSAADGKGGKGKFGALGFQYGGAAGAAKGTGEDAPFTPSFDVPEDMVLPSTIRVHRIIGQTARRIREKPQLEFLLKIKQADNATFSFLQDSDPLHPYYLMLKEEEKEPDVDYTAPLPDEDAKQKAQEEAERQAKVEAALKKRAVKSLLGNAYYSDDEEADDEVLEPGPEMKAVMEKLATFVKRNGKAFEDKVAEREANNPRFAFLKPDDIFHKYYRQLVGPSSKTDSKPKASEKQASVKTEAKQEQQQGQVDQGQEGREDKAAAEAPDASKHAATTNLLLPPTGKADPTEPSSDAAAADPSVAAAARAPADVGTVSAALDAAAKDGEGVEGSGNTSAVEERGSESEGGGGDTAGGGTEGEEGQTEEMRRRAERLKRARMMQGHFKIALLSPPAPAASSPVTASATDPLLREGKSDDVSKAVAKYIESEAKQNGAGEQGGGDRKEEEEPREPHEDRKKSKKKHKKKDKRRDRSPSAHDDDGAHKKKKAEASSRSRGDRSTDRSSRRKGDEGRSRERDTHRRRDRSRSRSRSHSEGRKTKRDRSDSRVDRHRSRSRGRKKRR